MGRPGEFPGDRCTAANETSGVVVRVENDLAWIEVDRQSCGQCSGKTACGSGLLGLQGQARRYCLPNTIGARVGDGVMISLPTGSVLKSAMLAYAMPLGCGMGGAALATLTGAGDLLVAMALMAGVGIGWLILYVLRPSREPAAQLALKPQVTFSSRLTKELRP